MKTIGVIGLGIIGGTWARHYAAAGADPARVRLVTFSDTGAPEEHAGFGRYSNDAKLAMVDFLTASLGSTRD